MLGEHLLHRSRRQAVARHVDDVVGAAHDVEVSLAIEVPGVAREVVPLERRQVGAAIRRRSGTQRQLLEAARTRADRPAGLGLPPVVDHGLLEERGRPRPGVRVEAFAGEEQRVETAEVPSLGELGVRIGLADRAEGGRGGEQGLHPVVGDHPPERARIGGADGLALVQHGGRAGQEGSVDDVRVADHPAHVARRPHHVACMHVVDVRHRPRHRDGMAAVVAHHSLRRPGRARGVEDVERIGRRDRDRRVRGRERGALVPVPPLRPRSLEVVGGAGHLCAVLHDHRADGVRAEGEGVDDRREVLDDPARFDSARGRDDDLGRRVVEAGRELLGREASEDHRVHGAEAGAGEHRRDRLGHHRHVDDDPVALADPGLGQQAGEAGHLVEHGRVAVALLLTDHGGVVDDGILVAPTGEDVPVERVVAGVHHRAGEPAVEGGVRVVERDGRSDVPVDRGGRLEPESLAVGLAAQERLVIRARAGLRRGSLGHG